MHVHAPAGKRGGRPLAAAEDIKTTANLPVPARRVLVAEDNAVTNDLLRLLLTERGHDVDIVADGEEALGALQKQKYDVVLMDFHLPKMDGVQVATAFREGSADPDGPRFVGITSDMKGLLTHAQNCENFDTFVPKPLNLDNICKVIEGDATEVAVAADPVTGRPDLGTVLRPTGPEVDTTPITTLGYNFLRWPDDFAGDRLSARGLHASLGDRSFDALLVCEPMSGEDLWAIWRNKSVNVLPVIDLTGTLGRHADLGAANLTRNDAGLVEDLIAGFHDRRAKLHPDLLYSDDVADKLLARVFVSGTDLIPAYAAEDSTLVAYNTTLDSAAVRQHANSLAGKGLLSERFFDRAHQCDRCGSSRFNVREVCAHCRSSDLVEEAYIHHFTCAYQGPESDFRVGDDLICPKCRRELSHFSVDYDKPGSVLKCRSCGKAEFDAVVGFVCVDCSAEYFGDTVLTTEIKSYALTDEGRAYAQGGRAALDGVGQALRFTELPLGLVVAVNGELKRFREDGTPFTVVEVSYRNEGEIAAAEGPRQFQAARDLFLENLRNGLRDADHVFRGHAFDFVLIAETAPSDAYAGLEQVRAEASELLRFDLGIEMRAHEAEAFA